MKENQKYAIIGMVVAALVIVFVAYQFIYSKDVEAAEKVQAEIVNLQARVTQLNEKNANRAMYEAGIANADDIIDTILALYGPGNTAEKTIMMVVDLCNKTGAYISDISFQNDRLIYSSQTMSDGKTPDIQIFQGGMSVSISAGYTQFKKLTDYINSYPERMNAQNFNVSFDAQSGRLNITMSVNFYAVKDDKHEYVAPVIEDIELGNPNIFKTFEVLPEEETGEEGEGLESEDTSNDTTETVEE